MPAPTHGDEIRQSASRERREEILRAAALRHRLRANSPSGRRAAVIRTAVALRLAASARRAG